jgi:cytochrome P450
MTRALPAAIPGPKRLESVRILRRLLRDPAPVLDELATRYGPLFSLDVGPVRIVVVGDPALTTTIFAMPNSSFRWGYRLNLLGFVVGPTSMIVSDGDDHRRRRRAVTPAFARRRLDNWIPTIVSRTDAAIDSLLAAALGGNTPGSDAEVDLYPVGRALVLDIVVRVLFGERLASRATEIGELFKRPQAYIEAPAVRQIPHPFPIGRRPKVRSDRRALDALINTEIAHRRASPQTDPSDIIATLVTAGDLSDDEIRDQVVTLIGAGYDTTAASLAWLLWRATQHRELWDQLRAEATIAFDGDHSSLLAALPLADRVMREALRLHPAGLLSPRETATDLELGRHRLRRGTLVLWSAYLVGRNPGAWADPLRFNPDRFVALDDTQKIASNQGWIPFGGGARNCIGFALAQMELTIILARFAQRLDLTATSHDIPRPQGMVVNRPVGGVPLHVAPAAT